MPTHFLPLDAATALLAAAWLGESGLPGWAVAAGFVLAGGTSLGLFIWLWWRVAERTRERDASEERFRALFDHAAVPIVEEDFSEVSRWLDGLRASGVENLGAYLLEHPDEAGRQFLQVRPTAANRRGLELLGADDMEDFAEKMRLAGAAATPETFALELETLWSGQSLLECETILRVPGRPMRRGKLHWMIWKRRGLPDPSRVLLTFTDLSELQASEERYQRLFESLPIPAWVFDVETLRFLDVNGAAVRAYGWSRAEFLGMRAHDIRPTEDIPAFIASVAEPLSAPAVWRHRTKDGRLFDMEVTSREIEMGGRKAQMSIARDVTETRRIETALRASEERHRGLFEHAAEGIYESTPNGGLRSANPALARLFGYASPQEMIAVDGGSVNDFYVVPARRSEFLAQIGPREILAGFESEARRKDGTTFWISENVRAVRDAMGRVLHLQGFVSDITARRRAEDALRESEARHRALFEQSPIAIVELDYAGLSPLFAELREAGAIDLAEHVALHPDQRWRIVRAVVWQGLNEAAVRALRAETKQQLTSRLADFTTPEAMTGLLETVFALWRGENWAEGEAPLLCLDGSLRQFYWRWWMPVGSDGPKLRHAQVAFLDVTDMRRTEAALRASEQRYRILFESSPMGMAECDFRPTIAWLDELRARGVTDLPSWFNDHPAELSAAMFRVPIVGANQAALRLVGASTLEELIANETKIYTADFFTARGRDFVAAWTGRNEEEGEIAVRSLDGAVRRVYYRMRIPMVEGRPYYERVQVAILDLTDVKSVESHLAAERERLSVTLRAMTEGVITVDTCGVVQFINEAASAAAGWRERGAVGTQIDDVFVLRHERTGIPVRPPVQAALEGDRPIDLPPQTQLVRRDGTASLVEGRCAPMHDLAGGMLGAVLVFRDVTERSRLESELLRASKLESVGVLAGGIAHDFNNLLTVVMGNLSVALLDEAVMQKAGRWLKEAERGAQRAKDLTQQLLTFSKGGEPVRSTVRLQDVVREAAGFATHGANVRCEFDLAADLRAADVDKGQIGQVVQNLAINAVHAMPDGGVIRITLRNDKVAEGQLPLPPGDYLLLSIVDAGTGIPAEYLSHIFEPYFTTKKDGTGLGLATVYSIVSKHRGHIRAESEPGKGAVFHVWLPAAKTEPPPAQPSRSPFERMSGRILFMDDEDAVRAMASALLTRLGLEVTAVSDGESAVQAFIAAREAGRPFNLVMMDLTVPGAMGGREAMRAIQAIDPDVRGVVSSGYSSDPVMANYRQHGFKGMVPKPYRVDELARVLREVLEEP